MRLTSEQVMDIRKRYSAGEQPARIARDYGIHSRTAYRAATCRSYWRVGWEPVDEAHEIAVAYRRSGNYELGSYGTCLVDDPRLFDPDPQGASPGQLYAWADAVKSADAGEDIGNSGFGGWNESRTVHIMRTPWGLGVSWWEEGAGE